MAVLEPVEVDKRPADRALVLCNGNLKNDVGDSTFTD
jgi:hypothetical protein